MVQEFPFTITIVDPCDEPTSVTPSTLLDQEYTIMQASFDYIVPIFEAVPSWCAISYTYSITAIEGDKALVFDAATPKFIFYE